MLREQIKNTRKIKDNSLNTYISSLAMLNKKAGGGELKDTSFLKDFDKIMGFIKPMKITSQKNKITSVLVALKSDKEPNNELIDKYGKELKDLTETYNIELKNQQKTKTQEKNWIDYNQLLEVINDITEDVKNKKLLKKEELTDKEFDLLQQLVILRTYLQFPIRNNYANMKIITLKEYKNLGDEAKNNNYLVLNKAKKYFYINQFKNQKHIGSKILEITPALNKIINSWLKYNKSGYFLVKNRTEPINANGITKFLNKIFRKHTGKLISTSMLRHIIISNLLKNTPTIKEKEEEEEKIEDTFLHSSEMNQKYRKLD